MIGRRERWNWREQKWEKKWEVDGPSVFVVLIGALMMALIIWAWSLQVGYSQDCQKKGGTMIQTSAGYECGMVKKLTV